ncbi:hypothetical protein AAWM_10470 [Aspergillus awamori]|uniref:Uncharacterized protein n=1 Tax=Aspergillus awamori TaxID=105351 RepID=A0A401L7Z3_ASPAW|nr:hypothetical protein AAWM_10470 [Aspergillus awamori]
MQARRPIPLGRSLPTNLQHGRPIPLLRRRHAGLIPLPIQTPPPPAKNRPIHLLPHDLDATNQGPTPASEKAYLLFINGTVTNLTNMGTELVEQEFFIRSALYTATALAPGSQKEADTGLKNGLLRPDDATDWPQLVIESGVSGSLHRLRQDVNWWIGCSEGMVLLVLLLVVDCGQRRLIIEKYFPQQLRQGGGGGPVTRARAANDGFVPQLVATTVVDMRADPPAVEGPPVILEFERVVGRRPVGPSECDIVFEAKDLVEIGGIVLRWIP